MVEAKLTDTASAHRDRGIVQQRNRRPAAVAGRDQQRVERFMEVPNGDHDRG